MNLKVDEASNMEENFIALVPDQSTVDVVNDEMRSNEISINPIATLVFQSEYPEALEGGDYIRNVSKSTPRGTTTTIKTPKSFTTSQEAEGSWSAVNRVASKGRGWGSIAKQQQYHSRGHRAKKHRHHHHHRDNRDFARNRLLAKKSRSEGKLDYFESNGNQFRDPFNRHNDKWSNFVRLQNELQQEQDLPPYMKKINRRTKQLRFLMEGTVPPRRARIPPHRHHVNDKFFEENVFEDQRSKKFPSRKAPEITRNSLGNSFPGEESDEDVGEEPSAVVKTATRAGNFIYHRIPSAKPSSGPTFGRVIRKQGLPFVAITDRRAKVHT
uniref:Uncharacterized protein n=1 Tax=Lutzomyia longipalpis TaxID=7200 RepID=A0A1B0GGZ5_LUTLO